MKLEEFEEILEENGVEDVFEFMLNAENYGGKTILMEENAGFQYEEDAWEAFYDSDSSQASLSLVQYGDRYYLGQTRCLIGGYADYDEEDLILEVFDSEEKARQAFYETLKRNVRPVMEQIRQVKKELPYPPEDVYIKMYHAGSFRVYYRHLLVMEYLRSLDQEPIRKAIEKLKQFEADNRIAIDELYKLPRAWNDNQRYYRFSGTSGFGAFCVDVHIPSKLQHRCRMPIDIILANKQPKVLEEIKKNEQACLEKAKSRAKEISCKNETSLLSSEEKLQLSSYLFDQDALKNCDCTLQMTQHWLDDHIAAERHHDI